MKVLVATAETQGQRENDFCFVPEGELVIPGFPCDSDRDNPDGDCGCDRCLDGIKSFMGTTTAKVVSMKITPDRYLKEIKVGYLAAGYPPGLINITFIAGFTATEAKKHPEGTVLEYRSGVFYERGQK